MKIHIKKSPRSKALTAGQKHRAITIAGSHNRVSMPVTGTRYSHQKRGGSSINEYKNKNEIKLLDGNIDVGTKQGDSSSRGATAPDVET